MAKKKKTNPQVEELRKYFPEENAAARKAVLAELDADLWAVPAEAVVRPVEETMLVALAARKLALVGREAGWPEADLVRLERIADAAYEAQGAVLWAPMPEGLDADVHYHYEIRARQLRTAATEQVQQGVLTWADIPRKAGPTVLDECRWALATVEVFRNKGIKAGIELTQTEKDANWVIKYAQEKEKWIRIADRRDRAYTLLLDAAAKARANAPAGTADVAVSIVPDAAAGG